jgi:hypothetical protein
MDSIFVKGQINHATAKLYAIDDEIETGNVPEVLFIECQQFQIVLDSLTCQP